MRTNKEQISLFVAEKPSVAKEIAAILSRGKNNKVSDPFSLIVLVYGQIKVQPNI
jgi:DNA topoisomerase IA